MRHRGLQEVYGKLTRAIAMTTTQIKTLSGRMVENKRAARAARTLEQFRAILFKKKNTNNNNLKLPNLRF